MKKIIVIIGILSAVGIWIGWYWLGNNDDNLVYITAQVEKGNIVQTVNATGIVQPVKLVQVGTQVNGPVTKLYVDFNSRVKKDETVAQIDPALYKARLDQEKANLIRSKAEVERVQANLGLAEKELARAQELAQRDLISQSELDTAVANREALTAQLKLSKANVEQSKSSLQVAEVNLQYTTIKSPVDGIVISRNVDEGQTVVASFQAQTLFTIATDLKKMKVEASISEADIGQLAEGQPVKFTVDAYPYSKFSGKIKQVRLVPTSEQNVVIYTVIIYADNPDEKLFPGMTANLACEVARRSNVLRVTNAALRFVPDEELIVKNSDTTPPARQEKIQGDNPHEVNPAGKKSRKDRKARTRLWVITTENLLKPIPVKKGITDGIYTEIVKGEVSEGQEIVTGVIKGSVTQQMENPFGRRRRR